MWECESLAASLQGEGLGSTLNGHTSFSEELPERAEAFDETALSSAFPSTQVLTPSLPQRVLPNAHSAC